MRKSQLLIDNLAFAKKHEHLTGSLLLEDCPRLGALLPVAAKNSSAADYIRYDLQGNTDAAGQPLLHLALTTSLSTTCQRCLSEMLLELNLNYNYLLGEVSDTDLEALDIDNSDEVDLLQINKSMDVLALIEDELITAMPIAPMHADACEALVMQSGEKPNPFAALKGLIKP